MNKKILLIALAVLAVVIPSYSKNSLNPAEKEAQKSMADFLRNLGYAIEIDERDQSVNFRKNDVLYWITFEGTSTKMLFTLHRKNIRFDSDKRKPAEVSVDCEVAEKAANRLNATHPYKAYLKGKRVHFEFPTYASAAKEYQDVFNRVLGSMKDIREDFDAEFKKSRLEVDSIHNHWADIDTVHLVVPQNNVPQTKTARNFRISSIAVRNLNGSGGVISGYDQGLRKNKCQYVQERVSVTANKPGVYKIGLRIVTPDGKILIPFKEARFTTVSTIDVKKAGKPEVFELEKFGTDSADFWEPGEYKLLFYEDDNLIYQDAFNIL